jgi:signal transduction histidine kinase/CheY-like chemotaxis protein
MKLQLRHRLILVWLGTIVLAMTVAAGLFMILLLDFHQANAHSRLLSGFTQLQNRISEISGLIQENGTRFTGRRDIVSSLSMIDRYQERSAYQPLVFDPEKKRLADALADLLQAAGLPQGVILTRSDPVAGFSGGSPTYLSYDDAGDPAPWFAAERGLPYSRQEPVPQYLQAPAPALQARAGVVRLRLSAEDSVLMVEGVFPLLRNLTGDEREIVGHLMLRQFLDKPFVDEITRRIGMDLLLCGEGFPPIGETALPCPTAEQGAPELSRLTRTGTQPSWLPTETHFAAAAILPLARGGEVYLVLGLNKAFLNAQIQALRTALLAGLLIATLLILGFGILYLRATLSRPLERLLKGIEAVSSGRFVVVAGADKADELGRVAGAFNTMAAKLHVEQQKLRQLNAELEQRVEQRTAEMEHARDSAEAANRAKSLFLANMSHELRTPLNAILGFAQLMQQEQNLTAKQRNDLATIDHSGQHLLVLINDVLEISRIESGRIAIELNGFNLRTMLASVEEMIRVRADKQGLSLRIELDEGLPEYVEGDEHRLRQVLINLLGNAVKYTESGWVALRVLPDGADADMIRFEVEDSGPGISEGDRQRIFEPFFQTSEGAAKGEGTGLGLTISRQYVELMKGKLEVESQRGKGSLFHFAIPMRQVDSSEVEEAVEERRVIGLEPGQRRYRILIVEDKPESRQLLRRILEGVGLTVKEAADGKEAVELFEQWRPHLIWMDMRMPVMDGYEATRRIKADPAGNKTIVIALTASAFEEDRSEVLAAGCDDFLRKPVRQSVIYAALERHLGIKFRYADEEKPAVAMVDEELAQSLERLPHELRASLRNQALALDTRALAVSIQEIEAIDSRLAEALQTMLEEYRFDAILKLLEGEPPDNSAKKGNNDE